MTAIALISIGFAAGIIGSLLGLGGGWLIVPGLNVLGWSGVLSVGTSLFSMFFNAVVSVYQHYKRGRLILSLGLTLGFFALFGVQLGRLSLSALAKMGGSDLFLRSAHLAFLLWMAALMFRPHHKTLAGDQSAKPRTRAFWQLGPLIGQDSHRLYLSEGIFAGLIAGIVSGLLGVGGGIILVPLLTRKFGLDIQKAVAISATTILFGALSGGAGYLWDQAVDYEAAFYLVLGSMPGSWIGGRFAERVPDQSLRSWFVLVALATAGSLALVLLGAKDQAPYLLFSGSGLAVCLILRSIFKRH